MVFCTYLFRGLVLIFFLVTASASTIAKAESEVVSPPPLQVERVKSGNIAKYFTDIDLCKSVMTKYVQSSFSSLPVNNNTRIVLESMSNDKNNNLVEDVLISVLLEKGYRVTSSTKPLSDSTRSDKGKLEPDFVILYRLAELRLDYIEKKKILPLNNMIQRRVQANLFLELKDVLSNTILWDKWLLCDGQDVVPAFHKRFLGDEVTLKRNVIEEKSKPFDIILVLGVLAAIVYISL